MDTNKFFLCGTFQNFFRLQIFIGSSYNLSCWENPEYLILGASRGVKGGSGGQKYKYGSKCLKLPKTSRKVVNLRSNNFQIIYLINTYEYSKLFEKKNQPPNFKITLVSQHRKLRFSWFNEKFVIGFFKTSAEFFLSSWKEMSADSCI